MIVPLGMRNFLYRAKPIGDAGRLTAVAQVPTADVDRRACRIVQLDGIQERRIGVREHFVDDDRVDRRQAGHAGRAAVLGAAAPACGSAGSPVALMSVNVAPSPSARPGQAPASS